MRTTALSLLLCVACLGCGTATGRNTSTGKVLLNPTGSCTAPDDGARPGYHSPGDSTWLPDCQNTLKREYWRVFAQTQTSAYIIPRPDGAEDFLAACGDAAHPLHDLGLKYLCGSGSSQDLVAVINDMDPADALRITHYLHTRLVFVSDGASLSPYPLPSDIVDACGLHAAQNSADLEAICERERQRLISGQDIGFDYTGPGAIELAARLNELYGIE